MLPRRVAAQRRQGRDQAERVQPRGVEAVRQLMHVAGDFVRPLRDALHPRDEFVVARGGCRTELREVDAEHRQLLAQIVVQFACNPVPLPFLRGNQPSGQVPVAFGRRSQLDLAIV